LGSAFESFVKGEGENETDAYDDLGFHLYYDIQDRLEFIESFEPAILTVRTVILSERNVQELNRELALLGFSAEVTDVGFRYPDAGIAFTVSDNVVESVAAHRKGYYDI
jgi:hypothetical protein